MVHLEIGVGIDRPVLVRAGSPRTSSPPRSYGRQSAGIGNRVALTSSGFERLDNLCCAPRQALQNGASQISAGAEAFSARGQRRTPAGMSLANWPPVNARSPGEHLPTLYPPYDYDRMLGHVIDNAA